MQNFDSFNIPAGKLRHGIRYICARYGVDGRPIHKSTIYRRMAAGAFPKPDNINGSNSWTGQVLDTYDDDLRRKAEGRSLGISNADLKVQA